MGSGQSSLIRVIQNLVMTNNTNQSEQSGNSTMQSTIPNSQLIQMANLSQTLGESAEQILEGLSLSDVHVPHNVSYDSSGLMTAQFNTTGQGNEELL